MSVGSLVQVGLLSFVLLAPTMMVAILISGVAHRGPEIDREPLDV
jgi:hypothetical protein